MRLDAIADLHARNIFSAVLEGTSKVLPQCPRNVAYRALFELEGFSPELGLRLILDDYTWLNYKSKLQSSFEPLKYRKVKQMPDAESPFEEEDSACLTPEELKKYFDITGHLLDLGRSVYLAEGKLLLSGKYCVAYLEECADGFLNSICNIAGTKVVMLDKDNPYCNSFHGKPTQTAEYREAQRLREGYWMDNIPVGSGNSILIAGADHIEGNFGLVDGLRQKNYELHKVLSFDQEYALVESHIESLKQLQASSMRPSSQIAYHSTHAFKL